MDKIDLQIIKTIAVLFVLVVIRLITNQMINRTLKKLHLSYARRKLSMKVVNFFMIIGAVITITAIWGIKSEQLILFLSSVLTILGIAFFAQWSILSNITAGLILFFNHPLRLGDHIRILEKDFIIEGEIKDISFFFLHLQTESGENITIPNSVILQKTISIISKHST
jgi:small-conductance mechanosensitive channel